MYCLAYRFKHDLEYRRLITADISLVKAIAAKWKYRSFCQDIYCWSVQEQPFQIPDDDLPTPLVELALKWQQSTANEPKLIYKLDNKHYLESWNI